MAREIYNSRHVDVPAPRSVPGSAASREEEMQMRVGLLRRLVLVAAIGFASLFFSRTGVSAHASYDHSNPSDKQVLATAPAQLSITFVSEIVADPGTFAFVSNGDMDATAGPSRISPSDPTTPVVPLKPNLPNGKYDVFWKSTDADDGGVTFGHFSFFVGNASPGDVAAAASVVAVAVPDDATQRALNPIGTMPDEGSDSQGPAHKPMSPDDPTMPQAFAEKFLCAPLPRQAVMSTCFGVVRPNQRDCHCCWMELPLWQRHTVTGVLVRAQNIIAC